MQLSVPFFVFALLFSFIAFVHAQAMIDAPPVVAAGVPFNATLTAEYHPLQKATYAYALRVYLGSSPFSKAVADFYNTDCYLIHEQTLCDPTINITVNAGIVVFNATPFTVTIPPSVGPSGKHYAIAARVMNTDGSYYTGQMYSDVLELTGANGTWANFQRQGNNLWGDDGMSCSGFSCVKDCANGPNITNTDGSYRRCINSCPGVSVDPNSSRGGAPTAARVVPSACSSAVTSRTTATVTMTSPGGGSRSSSRTAAAAAPTGAAVARSATGAIVFALFPFLVMVILQG
ncbi:hypothetical protein FB567DRAFT_98222 [Paraphoma chrysanthemicola]|uniref:Uncharacterized protein n=1 Tax=Paraphoma chrysanthemicola TaxID=798071 RepID=A0A8K0R1M9_9PLEO|nr:hypothetical protein FB567DRAFT_98222 [Paraphoma chrysanthemicola]